MLPVVPMCPKCSRSSQPKRKSPLSKGIFCVGKQRSYQSLTGFPHATSSGCLFLCVRTPVLVRHRLFDLCPEVVELPHDRRWLTRLDCDFCRHQPWTKVRVCSAHISRDQMTPETVNQKNARHILGRLANPF